jgi:two-component system, OmpR family, alkaline phosphatase synthesis response regulator PhoP
MEPSNSYATLHVGVVDRDLRFSSRLCTTARELGWEVTAIAEPPDLDTLMAMRLDVLLMDTAAIDTDDAGVYRPAHLAMASAGVTVIACSERSTPAQRAQGLRAGLDGWIDKDCDPHELLARAEAIVRARRGRRLAPRQSVRSGELWVDATRYDVVADGRGAGLTTREFEVLALLVEHRGSVLERERIYTGVWGTDTPTGDRSVDMFISRIRLKLKYLSPGWSYLHTHVGAGYRFEAVRDNTSRTPIAIGLAVAEVESIAA